MLHIVDLIRFIFAKELTSKILSRVGGVVVGGCVRADGLSGDKANLSPAKLKLAEIWLELSLAIVELFNCSMVKLLMF